MQKSKFSLHIVITLYKENLETKTTFRALSALQDISIDMCLDNLLVFSGSTLNIRLSEVNQYWGGGGAQV